MRIVNQCGFSLAFIKTLIQNSVPSGSPLLAYFDDKENRTRRDRAAARIEANLTRGWQPYAWDLDLVDKLDADWHAVFCAAEIVATQDLPEYVKAALRHGESLIYLDKTITASDPIFLVTTVAHECRHAWQYFVHPVVYFGHNVLNFVNPPQSLPAETDAELFAKRTAIEKFGEETTLAYVRKRLGSAPENQKWFWQRLIDLTEPEAPIAAEAGCLQ